MSDRRVFHPTSTLLAGAGVLLVVAAAVFNEFLLGLFDPAPPLATETVSAIRVAQMAWAIAGVLAIGLSIFLRRVPTLARATGGEGTARGTLLILSLLLPIAILEMGLRPWVVPEYTTTLFTRDDVLGWRHRRGISTQWQKTHFRINGKGLRGPELPYAKPAGVVRILWLGDSVTFGDKVAEDASTFPYQAELRLEEDQGLEIETLNAGVSGYSPWQELQYLRDEGLRYSPDVIVVNFVPNDVTDLLELRKFGGSWEGWQLWYTRSPLQHALGKSAFVHVIRRALAYLRFGGEVQQGATRKEVINVQALVDEPDRPDVQAAWQKALKDLSAMGRLATSNGSRFVLVGFPFALQADDAPGSTPPPPQQTLRVYAAAQGIPFLDILPLLRTRAVAEGVTARDYFIDHVHLTPRGNQIVAEAIAAFLIDSGVISMGTQPRTEGRGS